MSADPPRYVADDPEPPHPAVIGWADRLHGQIGDWVSRSDIQLVVDELLFLLRRDLAHGMPIDLAAGRLIPDGAEWVWIPSE